MTEPSRPHPPLTRLRPAEAAERLRDAGARGFLGLDPVTQNDALLAGCLTGTGAQVFATGDAVVGFAPNPDNPRQAVIATTSDDPATVTAFAGFLREHGRFTSFVSLATREQPAVRALLGCGFAVVARLRDHVYRRGTYHDVSVFFATGESACAT